VIFSGRAGVMSALVLFTTDNGGRTWRADRVLPALGEVRAFPTTVADETLIAGRITDRSLTLIRDARGGTVRATAKIAPERSAVTALSFVDSTDGWALVQYNGTMTSLLSTSDGGNTWTDVTPRPEHKPYPAAARTRSVQSDALTETLIGPSTLQTVTPTAAPATGGGFSFWSGLPALSVAAALSLPLLLAALGLAVASPSLPRPPPARLLAARLAAIARQRLLGPEDPLAALQQTNPTPGTTSPLLAFPRSGSSSALLIFGRG